MESPKRPLDDDDDSSTDPRKAAAIDEFSVSAAIRDAHVPSDLLAPGMCQAFHRHPRAVIHEWLQVHPGNSRMEALFHCLLEDHQYRLAREVLDYIFGQTIDFVPESTDTVPSSENLARTSAVTLTAIFEKLECLDKVSPLQFALLLHGRRIHDPNLAGNRLLWDYGEMHARALLVAHHYPQTYWRAFMNTALVENDGRAVGALLEWLNDSKMTIGMRFPIYALETKSEMLLLPIIKSTWIDFSSDDDLQRVLFHCILLRRKSIARAIMCVMPPLVPHTGSNPFDAGARVKSTSIVKQLLGIQGAAETAKSSAALRIAVENEDGKTVKVLIDSGLFLSPNSFALREALRVCRDPDIVGCVVAACPSLV